MTDNYREYNRISWTSKFGMSEIVQMYFQKLLKPRDK
jgi:hypothetical protein